MTTVAAGLVRDVVAFARREGAKEAELLNAIDVTRETLEDQDNRLPATAFVAVLRAAARQLNRPTFCLDYGSNSRFDDVSIVGLIAYGSNSMAEGFEQMNRYAKLVLDTGVIGSSQRFQLVEDGDCVWIEDHRPNPNITPELTETVFARFVGDYDRYFAANHGRERPFRAFEVTYEAPAHADAYEALFRFPVRFGAQRNALLAHKSWLRLTTGPKNRYAFGVLMRHADTLLAELQSSETTAGQVERILLPILHKGDISMEKIAADMGISRPTLYRKLKEEGLTFEQLLDGLRHRMAVQYLEGGRASVNEVAYLVGFSEPPSFTRAFKRWTGMPPSAYR